MDEYSINFENLFEDCCTAAQEDFLRDGGLMHVIYALVESEPSPTDPRKQMLLALPDKSGNDAEKAAFRKFLRETLAGRVTFYVELAEAWSSIHPANMDDTIGKPRPSLDPNRKEVLIVNGGHKDGRTLYRLWEIKRKPLRLEDIKDDDTDIADSAMGIIFFRHPARTIGINPATGKYDWKE